VYVCVHVRFHRTIVRHNQIKLSQKINFNLTGSKNHLESINYNLKLIDSILRNFVIFFDEFSENKALPLIRQISNEANIKEYDAIIHDLNIYTQRNKIVQRWGKSLEFLDKVFDTLNDQVNANNYTNEENEILQKLNSYICSRKDSLKSRINKLKNNQDSTNEERENLQSVIRHFEKKKISREKEAELLDILLYEKPKKLANKDIFNKKNMFQIFTMGIIAIPTSVFVTDNFSGPVILNGLISFITGFAVYKIPDVKTIFKK